MGKVSKLCTGQLHKLAAARNAKNNPVVQCRLCRRNGGHLPLVFESFTLLSFHFCIVRLNHKITPLKLFYPALRLQFFTSAGPRFFEKVLRTYVNFNL